MRRLLNDTREKEVNETDCNEELKVKNSPNTKAFRKRKPKIIQEITKSKSR